MDDDLILTHTPEEGWVMASDTRVTVYTGSLEVKLERDRPSGVPMIMVTTHDGRMMFTLPDGEVKSYNTAPLFLELAEKHGIEVQYVEGEYREPKPTLRERLLRWWLDR